MVRPAATSASSECRALYRRYQPFRDRCNRSFTARIELAAEIAESNRCASFMAQIAKIAGQSEGQGACGPVRNHHGRRNNAANDRGVRSFATPSLRSGPQPWADRAWRHGGRQLSRKVDVLPAFRTPPANSPARRLAVTSSPAPPATSQRSPTRTRNRRSGSTVRRCGQRAAPRVCSCPSRSVHRCRSTGCRSRPRFAA